MTSKAGTDVLVFRRMKFGEAEYKKYQNERLGSMFLKTALKGKREKTTGWYWCKKYDKKGDH